MANRPVFSPVDHRPFYAAVGVDFGFHPGFAVVQKQKNITALHSAYKEKNGGNVLEISTKSLQPDGVKLSAFNLTKYVSSLDKRIPVECIYQGSKVFEGGGPYTDLYLKTPREAKRDPRLTESGRLVSFRYEGREYDSEPSHCFYDWLYIQALAENPEIARCLTGYDAFTDIEFNPNRSINCQARAAAIYAALCGGEIVTESFDHFRGLFV